MQYDSVPFPTDVKVLFSRCDICEKSYDADESEINNPTSAISEEELQQQEPLLLLCNSCRQELEVLHTFNV
jgi:uncharacterized CHY-type Zn-finger protein